MTTHPGSRAINVVLRDGSIMHVSPAKPADAPAVRLLLNELSARSRWLRSFSACPQPGLLCQLVEAANKLGIQVLVAEVLPENRQMIPGEPPNQAA